MRKIPSSDNEAASDDDAMVQKYRNPRKKRKQTRSNSPVLDDMFDEEEEADFNHNDDDLESDQENTSPEKPIPSNLRKKTKSAGKSVDNQDETPRSRASASQSASKTQSSLNNRNQARPNANIEYQAPPHSNNQAGSSRPTPPVLTFAAALNPERKAAIYTSFKVAALTVDLFPVPGAPQQVIAWQAFAKMLGNGNSVTQTKDQYSADKLAIFNYDDILNRAAKFIKANNPYNLPEGSEGAAAAAADLITTDSKYLFVSKVSSSGRLLLQSQFLSPAFLRVATHIATDSSVSNIRNFRELSKHPEFMFACAAVTRHLLERIALQQTGTFNESCSSALVYSEYMEILADSSTQAKMEQKAERFHSELEKKIKKKPDVGGQKCDSDVGSDSEAN
ncbi:hypothetical protein BDR26DRAFT_1013512 [Obelidium mucronatum]|nr:hypothetical protein BDR26DRAFT_1013512 [Obelidium mucronatum]